MAAVSRSLHEPVTSDLGLSDVTSLTSSRDSPPPTAARLPPDGHEFPPDFSLTETPSESRPNELAKVASRVHRRGHDPRSPDFGGFSRDQRPRSMLFESRSEPRSRGCQRSESLADYESGREQRRLRHPSENDLRQLSSKPGSVRTSVRDRIALFSSVSKEKLTEPKQIPSGRDSNETVGKGSRQSQTKDQERSKSDLKLTGNETQKLTSGHSGGRRKKISDPFGVIFGSTGGMHWPTGMSRMSDNGFPNAQETPSVVSQCSIHISRSHSRESSAGRSDSSEERDVCTNSLSERSQSLLDLGRVEKRHSYAGFNRQGPVTDLPRKTSLNSIIEERKKSFSKLRGLIIPNKVDGVTKRGPADMPAIKSKELPALSKTSSQMLSPMHSPRPKHPAIEQVDRRETHYLASPPWKADSPSNIPKYSPAFKRKNVSVYTSSPRSSGSAFRSVSSSSRLGGSSIELSRSPSTHEVSADSSLHRLHVRSLQQKIMEPGREPLQRSSSLNSRPTGISGETRRRVSDDLPGSRRHPVGEEDGDVGSSTLTLVAEPLDELTVSNTELRSRANSVEFDYRASTSTLHGSPVKDIDIEEEFRISTTHRESIKEEEEPRSLSDDEVSLIRLKTSESKNVSVSRSGSSVSSHHERPDKLSGSPPKIQEDGAWRKFASAKDSASLNPTTGESRDLTKLRQSTTKPSVKSLKERWQMLSGESDSSVSPTSPTRAPPTSLSRSPSAKSDRPEAVTPTRSEPVSLPSTAPAPPPSKDGAPTSVRDVVDRNWPSIESERADIDRKLSTPTYGDATLRQRDRKGRVPSRPQSWVENEKELKVFEMGGLIGGGSTVSTSSSQENIMDALDAAKSPSGSTSSLLEMLTANLKNTARSKHVLSVSDLRRAFERSDSRTGGAHLSLSAMEANGSEEGHATHQGGSTASLHSTKEHYGSITSLASSTSLISPHELQQLIEEANQSLEEAGTPSHEIIVAVIHREMMGGSVGITLAGGADYENKEISVNKVITGSVADRDGRIKKGDRVISINGRSMKNTTHREALNVLKAPRAEVVLVLSRSRSVTPSSATDEPGVHRPSVINTFSSRPPKILESPMDSKSLAAALEFDDVPRGSPAEITLFKEGAGVGFSLEGGKDSPMGDRPLVAKKIFTGGAADKNGQLQVGDQILAINGEDVTNMPRIEAWNFLKKQPEGPLKLTIRKRVANGSAPAAPSIDKTTLPASAAEGMPSQSEQRPASRPVVAGVTPKVAMATPEVVLPKA